MIRLASTHLKEHFQHGGQYLCIYFLACSLWKGAPLMVIPAVGATPQKPSSDTLVMNHWCVSAAFFCQESCTTPAQIGLCTSPPWWAHLLHSLSPALPGRGWAGWTWLPWQMWWVSSSCTSASSHIPGRTGQFVQYGNKRAREAGKGRAEGKGFLPPHFTVEKQVCLIAF